MDKDKIKQEAKEIMDNFMSALSDIEVEEEFELKRDKTFRNESIPNKEDVEFKNRFLSNAKNTSGDAILANKGDWTKN